jgi:hypothetical protein
MTCHLDLANFDFFSCFCVVNHTLSASVSFSTFPSGNRHLLDYQSVMLKGLVFVYNIASELAVSDMIEIDGRC